MIFFKDKPSKLYQIHISHFISCIWWQCLVWVSWIFIFDVSVWCIVQYFEVDVIT